MAINDYLQGINNATAGEKTDVSNAAQDLATLQEGAGSLVTKLKEALNTKLNNNKDIINQQSQTMQNYFNSGAEARNKYRDVWDPFKKAELVQQERSMALRPYDTLSGVLENRMGSVNDIVQSGIQGWQGLMDAAGTKLDLAKTKMATALQSYLAAAGQQQAADALGFQIAQAKEASRQYNTSLDYTKSQDAQAQANWEKEYGLSLRGSGGGGSDVTSASDNEIDAYAAMFRDGKITPSEIPQKIRGQVLSRAQSLNEQAAQEQREADKKNQELAAQKKANSPFSKFGNWVSNYFNTHDYSPTIYGGTFIPKK